MFSDLIYTHKQQLIHCYYLVFDTKYQPVGTINYVRRDHGHYSTILLLYADTRRVSLAFLQVARNLLLFTLTNELYCVKGTYIRAKYNIRSGDKSYRILSYFTTFIFSFALWFLDSSRLLVIFFVCKLTNVTMVLGAG